MTRVGNTPLHLAAEAGMDDIIRLLLKQPGVIVNVGNISGRTPLMLATIGSHAQACLTLLRAGMTHVKVNWK